MSDGSWHMKLKDAVLILLGVAIVGRLVWEILRPLAPGLAVAALLLVILSIAFRGPRMRL